MFRGTFYYKTQLPQTMETVWSFFQTNENLAKITGFPKIEILGDKDVFEGSNVHLKLNFFIIKLTWQGEITKVVHEAYFIDKGVKLPFPFKSWEHVHAFKKINDNETRMIDKVEYESFFPPFLINIMLKGMFTDRKRQLKKKFA